jgi:hypothetical protein
MKAGFTLFLARFTRFAMRYGDSLGRGISLSYQLSDILTYGLF